MYIIIAALADEVVEIAESEREHLVICGIGKLKSLMALSNRIHKHDLVSAVINLGTAGSDRLPAGSLVESVTSYQRDTTFFSPPISLKGATDLPRVACGTSDRLMPLSSNDPWSIVDMELYSLAFFCQEKSIPLVSIKYVTDRNDAKIYNDWKKHLSVASKSLCHYWMDQKRQILSNLCPK